MQFVYYRSYFYIDQNHQVATGGYIIMVIQPKGAQKDVLALDAKGHTVVLGTAGSGKTTMALLLAEKMSNLGGHPKVLVVTFNRTLVTYMKDIQSFSHGITVENFHHFALGYLKSTGKKTDNCVIHEDMKAGIIDAIVNAMHQKHPKESTFMRPVQTFLDEIQFLEWFGVESLEQYIEMERIGRVDAYISRENRHLFYAVYEIYKKKRAEAGYLYDWDDIAIAVYNSLLEDTSERRYSHIIVDEGQDFSPMMLKSLVKATATNGSFTFFGDVAQQIYGNALSWKASGISTQKIWRFENNYRNPREIALFAQDITKHNQWEAKGDEYVVPKFEIPAAGVKPMLVKYSDKQAEIAGITGLLKGKSGRNVVIVKNRSLVQTFILSFRSKKIYAVEIKKENNSGLTDGTYVTTFYSVKGLEFDNVYIPFLNGEDFPDKDTLKLAESENKVYSNSLKLFYVAATRAKQGLVMTYSTSLTPLFPYDSQNYDSTNT